MSIQFQKNHQSFINKKNNSINKETKIASLKSEFDAKTQQIKTLKIDQQEEIKNIFETLQTEQNSVQKVFEQEILNLQEKQQILVFLLVCRIRILKKNRSRRKRH